MPGWSVVLKKEARGKRITPTETEHCLGVEESSGDMDLFTPMQRERMQSVDQDNVSPNSRTPLPWHARRLP